MLDAAENRSDRVSFEDAMRACDHDPVTAACTITDMYGYDLELLRKLQSHDGDEELVEATIVNSDVIVTARYGLKKDGSTKPSMVITQSFRPSDENAKILPFEKYLELRNRQSDFKENSLKVFEFRDIKPYAPNMLLSGRRAA